MPVLVQHAPCTERAVGGTSTIQRSFTLNTLLAVSAQNAMAPTRAFFQIIGLMIIDFRGALMEPRTFFPGLSRVVLAAIVQVFIRMGENGVIHWHFR